MQTRGRLDYGGVIAALERDAEALAEAFSDDQKRQLGERVPRTPEKEARWWDDQTDTDLTEWKRQQVERARRLAEFGNARALAAEIRDERP